MKISKALKPSKKASVVEIDDSQSELVEQGHSVVSELIARLDKKYGTGTVMRAIDAVGLNVSRFSTGCYRLDFALGGGMPQCRMIEMFGNESAGKTTMLMSCFAQFQKKYVNGICALFDFERTFDPSYALNLGVDITRLIVISPDNAEQGADILNDILQSKEVHVLIGVDSIAAMTPTSTLEVAAEKAEVGTQARMINRVMSKCNARMKRNLADPDYPTTTVIFINQLREKVGVMFGNPETTPGGKGKDFYCSVRLRLFSSGASKKKVNAKLTIGGISKEILLARITSFEVVKNKSGGVPFEDGEYRYHVKAHKGYKAWTFDNEDALFDLGRFHGLIKFTKAGFTYKDVAAKQEFRFIDQLRSKPDTAKELYDEILVSLKKFNEGELPDSDGEIVEEKNSE